MEKLNEGLKIEHELNMMNDERFMQLQSQYEDQIDSDNAEWSGRTFEIEMQRNSDIDLNVNSPISAVLIVKNEQDTIKNCLQSLRAHVSEIIVLDTGSTDNTYHYLQTQKDITLHQKEITPWHFSQARNHALQFANKPYILMIDADEEVFSMPDMGLYGNNTVYWLPLEEMPGRKMVTVPRLFPNSKDYFFRGAVHNELVYNIKTVEQGLSGCRIYHWHSYSEVKKENRDKRSGSFINNLLLKSNKSFMDYHKYCQLALAHRHFDNFLTIWNRGYSKLKNLKETLKVNYADYLLYPCFFASGTNNFDVDHWPAYEHHCLIGDTIDNQFYMFLRCYFYGNFDAASYHALKYISLCDKGVTKPHQSSITICWKREVQFKYSVLDYYVKVYKA